MDLDMFIHDKDQYLFVLCELLGIFDPVLMFPSDSYSDS